jgi:hypothetical protein
MAEQAEWESVEKGSKLWEERQALFWKLEAERMFAFFDMSRDRGIDEDDQEREWKLRHLEIPFIRNQYKGDRGRNMLEVPDNQEEIREMVRINPLFQEGRFKELWLDYSDPDRIKEQQRQREEQQAILARRNHRERWQEIAQQERRADDVQSGIRVRTEGGQVDTIPVMTTSHPLWTGVQPPAQQPVQNLRQWMRDIETDERRRMEETCTQRRTRERRELIEENRPYLLRDGRFTGIVEDVRRLPNGLERQEVFRRFWANLYTQEYQNLLAREHAEVLSIRTATLRELEALEDEDRRESGGRELVRPLTLYREDGSLAGGWDRLSPVTEVRVSALE